MFWLRDLSQTETTFPLGNFSQNTSILNRIINLNRKYFVFAHHHPIISFCWCGSVLECQKGVSLAICASALLDELVSERRDNDDSSIDEEYRNTSSTSISSDSTLLPVSDSSCTKSEMFEVSSVDSNSILDGLLGIVA